MFVVAGSTIPTSIVEVATTLVEWPVVGKIAATSMAIARSVAVASTAEATTAVVVAELATEATAAMAEPGSEV